MKQFRLLLLSGIFLLTVNQYVRAAGFATRDLNPVLQQFYIPAHVPFSEGNEWRFDHSLYITNTSQRESKDDEKLIIDVENYRYELGLRYRNDKWITQLDIPLIANNGGELDGLIDGWHDFFGLGEGDRNDLPKDDIRIEYLRNGEVEYLQDSSSSGIGDVSLAQGYQLTTETRIFVGVDLPTGSESDFSGNEALDYAIWVSHEKPIDVEWSIFAMLGISFPGDDGNLEGLVVDEIWVAQFGADYRFSHNIIGTMQFDLHSKTIDDSDLDAFGNSLQIQLGLGFLNLIEDHRLDLFFSEDIKVGSAPDISFGARLMQEF